MREGAKKPKCQGEYEQAIEADSRSERAGLNTNGLPRQCAGRAVAARRKYWSRVLVFLHGVTIGSAESRTAT